MANGLPLAADTENLITWTDRTVSEGITYEYRVESLARIENEWQVTYSNDAICAGRELGKETDGSDVSYDFEDRGSILLIVDDRFTDGLSADDLSAELARLEADLVGDGWKVIREDVYVGNVTDLEERYSEYDYSEYAADIKTLIRDHYYEADSYSIDSETDELSGGIVDTDKNVQSVYLFGRIPVVTSGCYAPDGNGHGVGPLATDAYYGDMDGTWTDNTDWEVKRIDQITLETETNDEGDGKFDQNAIPAALNGNTEAELQVGRVDMFGLGEDSASPCDGFAESEAELLRRYLDKEHAYRTGQWDVQQKAIVVDTVYVNGYQHSDAYCMFETLPGLVGTGNTKISSSIIYTDYIEGTQDRQVYSWGVTLSTGGYDNCGGGLSTDSLNGDETTDKTIMSVFNTLTASWSVEWDYECNLLRSMLANDGYGLTISWAPGNYADRLASREYSSMALGATTGEVHQITQNQYTPNSNIKAHFTLLGDPTLRQHVIKPVSDATVDIAVDPTDGSEDNVISWTASPDALAVFDEGTGYLVYRYDRVTGECECLTTDAPLTTNSYRDPGAAADTDVDIYMIRMVMREDTYSGTYYNASQGVFCSNTLYDVNVGGDVIYNVNDDADWECDSEAAPSGYCTSDTEVLTTTADIALTNVDADLPVDLVMAMFQAARVPDAMSSNMEWNFSVGSEQTVAIDLYFAEIDATVDSAGDRVFDITFEDGEAGEVVEGSYDIYDEAGGTNIAVMETFTVTVGLDGILDIDLSGVTGTPLICGMEIRLVL